MTRILYIASVCAIITAGPVLVSCLRQWRVVDPQVAALLAAPSAVEVFAERSRRPAEAADGQASPLVVQARALAAVLDPPKPLAASTPVPILAPTVSPKRPVMARTVSPLAGEEQPKAESVHEPRSRSVQFSVLARSYYADRPGTSMALIAEPGGKAGSERWVREGHKLGHFVVHEIRQGAVVFRQGQDLREVAVDRPQGFKGLVTAVHSPSMREVGDTNTETQRSERNRTDRNKDNPLDEEAVAVSRASGS